MTCMKAGSDPVTLPLGGLLFRAPPDLFRVRRTSAGEQRERGFAGAPCREDQDQEEKKHLARQRGRLGVRVQMRSRSIDGDLPLELSDW